jgi:hypothetical protein
MARAAAGVKFLNSERTTMSFTYELTTDPRGYRITNGERTYAWTAAAPHVVQPTPDNGTSAWLEAAAQAAVEMFDQLIASEPAHRRRRVYEREADKFSRDAFNYQTEADALREAGDDAAAAVAEGKAAALRAQYLEKKLEIRAKYPDPAQ